MSDTLIDRLGRGLAATMIPLVAVLAAWSAIVLVFAPPPFLLPGPDRVAFAFARHFGALMENGAITALEIVLGLVCGVVFGVAAAIGMALAPWTARLVLPVIVVVQTLPVFAIAPVLVLWFGFGLASKIVMATLVIFFPVTASLHDGLSRLDPGLVDLARLHRASRFDEFRFLRLPAAVPALVSGLRMAATVAPIGAIIGEWVGASKGLGLLMMHANARLQTDLMFAALALLAVFAVALRAAIERLTRSWAPWAPETGPAFL
jgi:putative hydroxymethylpyrimidine transport system permease protein